MGVAIAEILPKESISFDEMANKRVAIDASNVIYQFLSSIRQMDGTPLMDRSGRITSHLQGLMTRTTNLLKRNIKMVFVFDGESPELKNRERDYRTAKKREAEAKFAEAKKAGDTEMMYKYSKQTVRLTNEIVDESREFIRAMGIPIVQAPYEAEAQAAFLCREKYVDYVGSQDADALVFGSPNLVRNLTLAQKRKTSGGAYISINPELIRLDETLKSLGINYEQFICLAILVGTDFNPGGVKGVGPKNALKIIKEYKKPEKIFEAVKADFGWKEVFDLFKNMKVEKKIKLEWKEPDLEKLRKILVDEHDFDEARVNSVFDFFEEKRRQPGLSRWF